MRKTEYPAALRDLVAQLRQMPGVGPRSAERIALWMVQARGDQPEQIARAISETRKGIHPCKLCGYFTTNELCDICSDSARAVELLCVVEQPTDILPLEKTGAFRGRYHSLGGCFFFSSRRRHTRFDCDWSSDVCSSDLTGFQRAGNQYALVLSKEEVL